jgi:N6-L-threonylcarbamoyladenine synthase
VSRILGIDTSNYTTSAAVYDTVSGRIFPAKRLLPVAEGERGLRQSDAVFAHIKALPAIVAEAMEHSGGGPVDAVCVSDRPRSLPDSYMPAFLAGTAAAEVAAAASHLPLYRCSHQQGHIAAALYSAGKMELLTREFYAFHVSGGTTECLLVRPDGPLFSAERIAGTMDLNAGQLVDRVGVLLGMHFPCGMELDALSRTAEKTPRVRVSFEKCDCHFSGAENQCRKLLEEGRSPAETARYAIEYVKSAVDGMTGRVMEKYGEKPVLYAGGVMSNSLIREELSRKYRGYFAEPAFSSDNAAGVALIGAMLCGEKSHE